jgi:peptide/nickel transport system substrate-binding protein
VAARLTRRDFVRAALGTAGLAVSVSSAGCSRTDANQIRTGELSSGRPRQGGALNVAIAGGGSAETLNPYSGTSPIEFARNRVVYDLLFGQENGRIVPRLATGLTQASNGKSFTLKIRQGVKWHDGSLFTVQDVLFTLRTALNPALPYPNELLQYLDPASLKVLDDRTLLVPLLRPVGDPAALLAVSQMFVIKNGTQTFEAGKVIGTGPFKVVSFQAGRSAGLQRFDDHWDGAPYLDKLVFLSIDDPNARVNAVLGDQADYATAVPYASAKTLPAGRGVEVRTAGDQDRTGYGCVLNALKPPFDNPDVRRAVRMAVDRKALVDTVFLGYGVPGNDVFGAGATYFARDIQPPGYNVPAARQLLQKAGAAGAHIIIRSAEIEDGDNASATLLAEQLKQIGLQCTSQPVSPTQFSDIKAMGNANAVVLSMGSYPLQAIYTQLSQIPPLAFRDPQYSGAISTALAAPDQATRAAAWRSVQEIQASRGNLLVWGFGDTLSVSRLSVRGVASWGTAKYPYFGKAWLA